MSNAFLGNELPICDRTDKMPSFSFKSLYVDSDLNRERRKLIKLAFIFNYFEQLRLESISLGSILSRTITFTRTALASYNMPDWGYHHQNSFCPFQIFLNGKMEDHSDGFVVDFANRYIGGKYTILIIIQLDSR